MRLEERYREKMKSIGLKDWEAVGRRVRRRRERRRTLGCMGRFDVFLIWGNNIIKK